jgi:uracil-DNA glycosylase family 4
MRVCAVKLNSCKGFNFTAYTAVKDLNNFVGRFSDTRSTGERKNMNDLKSLYLKSIGVEYLPRSESPVKTGEEHGKDALDALREEIGDCQRCPLGKVRKNLVFGVGNPEAELVFVGEAPGRDEDIQGEPFVGRAGQLLTRIIDAMGLSRDRVYICNVIKCRPPGNRDPLPDEIGQCEPFLRQQLDILNPRIVCALGSFAARTLLNTEEKISQLRGRLHAYNGIPLIPTYHPSYLLRNPQAKREVWQDVQKVMEILGLPLRRGGTQ